MRPKILLLTILLSLPWLVMVFFVNMFMQSVLLGDECQYHSGETSFLFDLFYDLPAYNGYHPWPSTFNYATTMVIPALYLGYRSAKKFAKYRE